VKAKGHVFVYVEADGYEPLQVVSEEPLKLARFEMLLHGGCEVVKQGQSDVVRRKEQSALPPNRVFRKHNGSVVIVVWDKKTSEASGVSKDQWEKVKKRYPPKTEKDFRSRAKKREK
jgi:hypothetical protein